MTSLSINQLSKVTLDIWSESPETSGHEPIAPHRVTFIFGIGVEGLCGMENALSGKTIGDELAVSIHSSQFQDMCGHLGCMIGRALDSTKPEQTMHMKVVAVEQASNREVVKAMAGGSACDCGCGC